MVWFKVDDGFYSSKKVLSIPRARRLAAVGLWTMAGNWSGRELSDGRVPNYVLAELGATPGLRRALVEARLWLDHGSAGVEFHSWADYQPTRAEVEADRAKAAERQRKWRERHKGETGDEPVSNGVTNDVTNSVSHDAPTRPDPTRPNTTPKGVVRASRRKPETSMPDDWQPKPTHVAYALERGVDGRHEEGQFRAWVSSKDARYRDWDAAFRSWLGRATPGKATPTARAQRTVMLATELLEVEQ
jgi:hypothetical protein